MKVSEHFTKREFEKSGTALRLGIDNTIKDHEHIMNLSSLCATVLEPIREKWGPMSISSGYRDSRVSEAVGSSGKSSHCSAMAADFECFQSPGNLTVFNWIIKESGISFDQCIAEYFSIQEGVGEPFDGWIHISSQRDKSKNRNDILLAVKNNGKTAYERLN